MEALILYSHSLSLNEYKFFTPILISSKNDMDYVESTKNVLKQS
jgi:hypothetical protein